MKILVIISNHQLDKKTYKENVKCLDSMLRDYKFVSTIDYCGISSKNDFYNLESVISFKYKVISEKKQLTKVCDFITEYKAELEYDWFIKFRPAIKILESFDFEQLVPNAINARARSYTGPKRIKNGMSVGGVGMWSHIVTDRYSEEEDEVILDDQIYFFPKLVVTNDGFDSDFLGCGREDETFHTLFWKSRNIDLNVIGINVDMTEYGKAVSGDLNIRE